MHRKWLVSRTNTEFISYIAKAASVSPVLAQILINRGIKTADDIKDFLHPGIAKLSDPFELGNMSGAVERIKESISRNQRILIHGDYDADGLSSTAIVFQALKALGADCHYFIPNRFAHGYGFNPEGVKKAKAIGAGLIITVDCGITSFEAVNLSNKEGIDVIITDHHEPVVRLRDKKDDASCIMHHASFELPDAVAVVNPKVSNRDSGLSNLSGAGIALKLVQALVTIHDSRFTIHDFLDLAALGTIADVVPVTGENRVIVSRGLRLIRESRRPGIRALIKISGMEGREIKAGSLSFSLIPRLNAAGRIDDASDVVDMLTTDSVDKAAETASRLDRLNSERQRIEEDIFLEAVARLKHKNTSSAIVIASESWHQGVIGIVASRISEQFCRPAVVLSIEGSVAKGSARSIPSFDICKAFSDCSELLIGFGGHRQAAGIKLDAANLDTFEKKLCSIFDSAAGIESTPSITIDADVNLAEINHGLVKELGMLEPLGYGNPEPLLASKMLEVVSPRIVGNNHVKMKLRHKSYYIDAIGFDMGGNFEDLNHSAQIDAVFTPSVNEWNGGRYLQLILKAFRPSL
ncbi:MAG: DHH family phosphoesterase [Nitrospirota bacterium]